MKALTRGASMALILAGAILILGASTASAATFSNTTALTIPPGPANASLYPSPVAVSGLSGTVSDVNVSLFGFSHTRPDDVGVLLVAPGGQAFKMMDGAWDVADATNINFTLDDSAAAPLPIGAGTPAGGTFRPASQYSSAFAFPAPGPGTAYSVPAPSGAATFASVFNGASPNGTWNLFVRDFISGDGGQFAGGWSLELLTALPPTVPSALGTQGTRGAKKCKKKKRKKRSASAAKSCKKKKKKRR